METCSNCLKVLTLRGELMRGTCNLCDMLASGTPPQVKSDTSLFTGGTIGLGPLQDPGLIEIYRREAIAAGVNPDAARYFPELAEYPGDPRAWCRDRAEMKQVLEERGWGCEEGFVKVDRPEPTSEPAPPPRLAESIVEDIVIEKLAAEGVERIDMSEPANITKVGDLREQAIEEHGRPLDAPPIGNLATEIEKDLGANRYSE